MDDYKAMTQRNKRRLGRIARAIALECRHMIQGCLREEEWRDCDREFEAIIMKRLTTIVDTWGTPSVGSALVSKSLPRNLR